MSSAARLVPRTDWGHRAYGTDPQLWDGGSVKCELGAEPTPEQYVQNLVEVFREVRRVLRPDGTCWLNLGSAYAAKPYAPWGIKPKDDLLMPHRVAMALQADSWICRADIVWSKPNPQPESVKDRTTKSHEYLFLLTKEDRYYYDAESIKEPFRTDPKENYPKRSRITGRGSQSASAASTSGPQQDKSGGYPPNGSGRNKRSVWTITPQQFKGAHFAVMPEALVEPCILAGTSEHGCCIECRAPYKRIIELGEPDREWQRRCGGDVDGEYHGQAVKDYESAGAQNASDVKARILAGMRERKTVGWQKTCQCQGNEVVPCLVLDPFSGSGTTCLVAGRLGRKAIGIDLNQSYCNIAKTRCAEFIAPTQEN